MAERDSRVSWEGGRYILWDPPYTTFLVYPDTHSHMYFSFLGELQILTYEWTDSSHFTIESPQQHVSRNQEP